jgi:hypothetical protein
MTIFDRLFHPTLLFLIVLLLPASCFVQADWERVPFTAWTKEHIKSILSDSRWSRSKTHYATPVDTRIGIIAGKPTNARILLRSALPIRQALLRQRQLDAKYDGMNSDQKRDFDSKNQALLECPACKDYFVVVVSSGNLTMDNADYVKDRKTSVYLSNDSGDKRHLIEFAVLSQQDNELIFYFPRKNEKGEDLLSPTSKTVTFIFDLRGLDGKTSFPFEKEVFHVTGMVKDGKVLF